MKTITDTPPVLHRSDSLPLHLLHFHQSFAIVSQSFYVYTATVAQYISSMKSHVSPHATIVNSYGCLLPRKSLPSLFLSLFTLVCRLEIVSRDHIRDKIVASLSSTRHPHRQAKLENANDYYPLRAGS